MSEDVRVIDGYEASVHTALSKGSAADSRAQIYAIMHLAEQVKRVADHFDDEKRRRLNKYRNAGF